MAPRTLGRRGGVWKILFYRNRLPSAFSTHPFLREALRFLLNTFIVTLSDDLHLELSTEPIGMPPSSRPFFASLMAAVGMSRFALSLLG
jgi:hypothetical protein